MIACYMGCDIPNYLKYVRKADKKVRKMEKELIVTINNLPQIESNKKLKELEVSKVTKTLKVKSNRTVKVTKYVS